MSGVSRLARLVRERTPHLKRGTLRIWGEWFGRPHDNLHTIVTADAIEDVLRLHFDQGELLQVWQPGGAVVDADRFRIHDASKVRWEWRAYGDSPDRKVYYQEFVRNGGEITATTDVDWYTPDFHPSLAAPAVEIL